jgi:pimeloyl-ACP methyl ester carboxylesterase
MRLTLPQGAALIRLLLISAVVLGAVGWAAASWSQLARTNADPYGRPGRLVALPDKRRINLRCSGAGSPTVILESGFAANSAAWFKVQPEIARTTRVCAYDRAGSGFSDPGPMPRDGEAIARDLDQTLSAAGIGGPYVVVGHSAGGLYARLFAARELRQTAGLVFVDSSVEFQDRKFAELLGPGAGNIDGQRQKRLRCLTAATAKRLTPGTEDFAVCVPQATNAHEQEVYLSPDAWRTQYSEIDTLFGSTSSQVGRIGDLLQDVPAIVLTASPTGTPASKEDPAAAVWQALHRGLADHFHQSRQQIVKSGHLMMIERPEVVTAAILELVARSRGNKVR